MRTNRERWQSAQRYEKDWWQKQIHTIDPEFYQAYAIELKEELNGIFQPGGETCILEIGSGAAGILTHLPGRVRKAIDPLESYYSTVERYRSFRDPDVQYFTGRGEELPFEDNEFDLIIIDNVLDHCQDVCAVLSEMKRVIKPGGIIYLRLNVYTQWGKWIRMIVERLNMDPGHPHTFTRHSLLQQAAEFDLKIRKVKSKGFWNSWKAEIRSMNPKEWLKALSLSTPNKTLFVLEG